MLIEVWTFGEGRHGSPLTLLGREDQYLRITAFGLVGGEKSGDGPPGHRPANDHRMLANGHVS